MMFGRAPKKSPSSSKGNKAGSKREAHIPEWSEWVWEEQYRREYRSRENPVGSGEWEYEYRLPEFDDTTPRSSQLDFTGGPPDSNQPTPQGYTTSSGTSRVSPPHPYATAQTSTGAVPLRARTGHNPSQPTAPLSTSTVTYSTFSLRPASVQYGEAYQGASSIEQTAPSSPPPTQLMTDSRGYPIRGRNNIQTPAYAEGDDDDGNNAPPPFLNPFQNPYAAGSIAPTSLEPSDARQRSDTNESDRLITSMDDSTGNESLDPNYKMHPGKDFKFARVFKILWTEPKGQGKGGEAKGTDIIPIKYGENAYASIRRFVVVKALEGHCLCLPILTYGGQATKKKGVKPLDHAIVYMILEGKGQKGKSGDKVERPKEIDGEQKLTKMPIRIKPLTPRDQLDTRSRLNYAKIYTVEYNVKVCFIGSVHENSEKYFRRDFNLVHTPLPEDPDTQYSDEDCDLGLSPRAPRAPRPREQRDPEERQQNAQPRERRENDPSRKEKKDKQSRGKGLSRS